MNADGIGESMAIKSVFLSTLLASAALLTLSPSYLGPYVFTRTLLPLLESTASLPGADVRIINASFLQLACLAVHLLKAGRIRRS